MLRRTGDSEAKVQDDVAEVYSRSGDERERIPEDEEANVTSSRFQSRYKRRSSLLRLTGDVETRIQDNVPEIYPKSNNKSRDEHKRTVEEEEEVIPFRHGNSRVKVVSILIV